MRICPTERYREPALAYGLSMLNAFSPCSFPKCRLMPQTSRYSVLGGHHSSVCLSTSRMNLQSQKFKLSADMCSSGTDSSSKLVASSPFPPDVSNCTVLFILVFCQAVKTFMAHFVLYLVFLGTVSDSKAIVNAHTDLPLIFYPLLKHPRINFSWQYGIILPKKQQLKMQESFLWF